VNIDERVTDTLTVNIGQSFTSYSTGTALYEARSVTELEGASSISNVTSIPWNSSIVGG
jgi:hypothetical protein